MTNITIQSGSRLAVLAAALARANACANAIHPRRAQQRKALIASYVEAQQVYHQVYQQCEQAADVLATPTDADPQALIDARYLLDHFTVAA